MKFEELYKKHFRTFTLDLVAGKEGLTRSVYAPEVERPGLSLAGYFQKGDSKKSILVFGKTEINFLKELPLKVRTSRLESLFEAEIPAVIVAENLRPLKEMTLLCETKNLPLLTSKMDTMSLISKLMGILSDLFAPTTCLHGCLVEVFGIGLLIQGDSAVGKSEAALGLVERGHALIADDVVKVRLLEDGTVEGFGPEVARHCMDVRGIGIINIATLYGMVCVREKKSLDIVVKLEVWDDSHFYGSDLEEKTVSILDIDVPYHVLPVAPGRDIVLLLETIALNFRLKKAGYHSGKEFDEKLLCIIEGKGKEC